MPPSSLVGGHVGKRLRVWNGIKPQAVLNNHAVRTKRTSSKNARAAAVSRAVRSNTSSSATTITGANGEGIFGLHPINYATSPPPTICASPPPPPPKPGLSKYTFPISAVLTIGLTAYFYVYNQNDSFAYWESMQTGGIPDDDDDDDDDELDLGDNEEK